MMTTKYTQTSMADGRRKYMTGTMAVCVVCKRASFLHGSQKELTEQQWKNKRATFVNLEPDTLPKGVFKSGEMMCGPCLDAIHRPEAKKAEVSNRGHSSD
tara:strand:+ start:6859 stop:7158 length:300 start_codon:yes stop_codon:yes gene_type:complete